MPNRRRRGDDREHGRGRCLHPADHAARARPPGEDRERERGRSEIQSDAVGDEILEVAAEHEGGERDREERLDRTDDYAGDDGRLAILRFAAARTRPLPPGPDRLEKDSNAGTASERAPRPVGPRRAGGSAVRAFLGEPHEVLELLPVGPVDERTGDRPHHALSQ